MVTKITSNEYLKRLDNMSLTERKEYLDRVGEWLAKQAPMLLPKAGDPGAAFQNVIQASAEWNDAECKAWDDGVRLLTSLVNTEDTWLPERIYVKAVKRVVRKLTGSLSLIEKMPAATASAAAVRVPETAVRVPSVKKAAEKRTAADAKDAPLQREAAKALPMKNGRNAPVRPRHIDQYVHLLPKATQEKAAAVKDLLRDLDTARENARRLMEAGDHPDKTAMWAKTATKLDDRVKAIYRELDAGWEKLVKEGRVTVDDFGNAHVIREDADDSSDEAPAAEAQKKRGRKPMTEEEKADAKAAREEKKVEETRQKVARLRKWLVDKRNAKTPGQAAKWRERYDEMVKIGGKESVTAKVTEAAAYYGIEISDKN